MQLGLKKRNLMLLCWSDRKYPVLFHIKILLNARLQNLRGVTHSIVQCKIGHKLGKVSVL